MFGSKPKRSHIELFEGLIIGGSLAAAATFIFGTKQGKDLQKKIVDQYKKLGRTTAHMKTKIAKVLKLHGAKKIKRAIKAKARKIKSKIKRRVTRKAA